MVVQLGGGALALICLSLLIVLGVNECSKGPLEPDLPDAAINDEQKDWLTVQHRIRRSNPRLIEISRDQQTLTLVYQPSPEEPEPQYWAETMLRVIGGGLAALNNAPSGKQYRQVIVKARVRVDAQVVDGATLTYDMSGFEAIKTRQDGYATFASAPQSLSLSAPGRDAAMWGCQGSGAGFYPEFCERVLPRER